MTDPILEAAVERLEGDSLVERLRWESGDCPFCGRDPYHYVDNGVGMERVAVTCCDEGIALFQHRDPVLSAQVALRVEAATEIERLEAALSASNARALAAEEALRPLADDPAVAALMDSQYRAGALAGWNAAHHADPEEGEKIMARIRSVEPGSLSPIVERNRARTTLASMKEKG